MNNDETPPTLVYFTKIKEGDDIAKVFREAYEQVTQGNGADHFECFMDELREKGFDCAIQRKTPINKAGDEPRCSKSHTRLTPDDTLWDDPRCSKTHARLTLDTTFWDFADYDSE